MGSMISTGVSNSYVVEEVNASPGTLWSIVTDVEAMPHFISAIKDVKVLGSTYDEYGGKEQESRSDQPSKVRTSQCRLRRTDSVASSKTGIDSVDAHSSCTLDKIRTLKEGFTWEETRCIYGRERTFLKTRNVGWIENTCYKPIF
jgi:Polyketide cyclase / dehydrase and lipid transport